MLPGVAGWQCSGGGWHTGGSGTETSSTINEQRDFFCDLLCCSDFDRDPSSVFSFLFFFFFAVSGLKKKKKKTKKTHRYMVHVEVEQCLEQLRRGTARLEPKHVLKRLQLGAGDAQALAFALRVNSTLTDLNLGTNAIGDAGAASFADALRLNTTLTVLSLFNNAIGDEGAGSLADALRVNSTLTDLNLGTNSIGDDGTALSRMRCVSIRR
jgi:hypothetical protein